MDTDCPALIAGRIRQRGPITAAEFLDLALYAPGAGYYARAAQRSGRTGDFYTSVDVGPLFGTLLASQFAALWASLGSDGRGPDRVDLVEVGAGNGRLSLDVLDAAARRHPDFYRAIALHLVERGEAAREAQPATLAAHRDRLAAAGAELPAAGSGIIFANELLDAFPVHVVEMRESGLAEVYVGLDGGTFVERVGRPSTPRLAAYLAEAGVALDLGCRAEINLAAIDWIAEAARSLGRGFILLVDYGYEAAQLYSPAHAQGTLATFHRHLLDAPPGAGPAAPAWLVEPGRRDVTSHVDWSSIRRAAGRNGLDVVRFSDQTRFLLDLLDQDPLVGELAAPERLSDRLALKTLLMPGGIGSTHSVLLLAKR
jgi:SAM-dependent MidA family methyltransferase